VFLLGVFLPAVRGLRSPLAVGNYQLLVTDLNKKCGRSNDSGSSDGSCGGSFGG
jgi:hypothetical protein